MDKEDTLIIDIGEVKNIKMLPIEMCELLRDARATSSSQNLSSLYIPLKIKSPRKRLISTVCTWERKGNSFRCTVVSSIREDSHGDPFTLRGSVPPGPEVIAGSLGSRHGRTGLACIENGSTSLLNSRHKLVT